MAIEYLKSSNKSLSILIGVLLSTIVSLVWWISEQDEDKMQNLILKTKTNLIANHMKSDMESRILSLQRVVNRWESRPEGTPKDEFYSDMQAYISDSPAYQAIQWIDSSFNVKWVIPQIGNEKAAGLYSPFEESRRRALENSINQQIPVMSESIDLVQGGKGFIIYFPIFSENKIDGFILAVFKIDKWLKYILERKHSMEAVESYKVIISMDNEVILKQKGLKENPTIKSAQKIEIMNHIFKIESHPTSIFFKNNKTWMNEVALAGALLFVLLISSIIYFFQKARQDRWNTELSKQKLEELVKKLEKTKTELHKASYRLDLATNSGNVGIWTWDIHSNKLEWNSIMYELYDIPSDAHLDYALWAISLHPEDRKKTESLLHLAVEGKAKYDTNFRIILFDGSISHVKCIATVERDTTGKAVKMTGVNIDITEHKIAQEKLHYIANHDTLTGLPTLSLLQDRMTMAINMAKRNQETVSVLFIDLDGFKSVNDTYGHDAGDYLLQEVSKRFISLIRKSDTLGRIGGDEFLLILTENHSKDSVSIVAEKLIKGLSPSFYFKGQELHIGASIGVSMYPTHGDNFKDLVKNADNIMYQSKKSGKNKYLLAK